MELLVEFLERSADDAATISDLMVDGVSECYVLEDKVREALGRPVAEWKIPKVTAIPHGRYKLTFVWSPHFACFVPLVNGVEGYSAVEVHWGNKSADTDGCLIVGRAHPAHQDWVSESNVAWDALAPKLEVAWGVARAEVDARNKPIGYARVDPGEDVWLTVDRGALLDPTPSAGA